MGNWGKDSQNKENVGQMRKSVCVNMIRRLLYTNLKLGMHQKYESKNSLPALAILYPLLLQWHKILSDKALRKILNWIIPFGWKCQLRVMY